MHVHSGYLLRRVYVTPIYAWPMTEGGTASLPCFRPRIHPRARFRFTSGGRGREERMKRNAEGCFIRFVFFPLRFASSAEEQSDESALSHCVLGDSLSYYIIRRRVGSENTSG